MLYWVNSERTRNGTSEGYLQRTFPSRIEIQDFIRIQNHPGIREFIAEVAAAESNLYIIDKYYDADCLIAIGEGLERNLPRFIRIVTGYKSSAESLAELLSQYREDWLHTGVKCFCNLGVGYFEYQRNDNKATSLNLPIHDRYAMIDDTLWHFGHTVGIHKASLASVSIWSNEVTIDAVRTFEELWDYLCTRGKAWEF